MAKIAWIGLGQMGHPMAVNLKKAGHDVHGMEVDPAAAERASVDGIVLHDDMPDLVADADVVFTMLPNGDLVQKVLLGDDGVFASAPAHAVVVDSSTIDVLQARAIHDEAAARGLRFLDAPVSGGISGAVAGTLTVMVGGAADTVEDVRSILSQFGGFVAHVGGPGAGQATKTVNNMILGINLAATCEGVALAERLGLDPQTLFEVVSRSSGDNWALRTWYPAPGVVDSAPSNRDFAAGFKTSLLLKDLGLALSAGAATGASLQTATLVHQLFDDHAAIDGGDRDCSSLIVAMRNLVDDTAAGATASTGTPASTEPTDPTDPKATHR